MASAQRDMSMNLSSRRSTACSVESGRSDRDARFGFHAVAVGKVTWFPVQEGGRPAPPPGGPAFSAIASFAAGSAGDFSIVLRYQEGAPAPGRTHPCDIGFLAPAVVLPRLRVGSQLVVKEGARAIGRCTIEQMLEDMG